MQVFGSNLFNFLIYFCIDRDSPEKEPFTRTRVGTVFQHLLDFIVTDSFIVPEAVEVNDSAKLVCEAGPPKLKHSSCPHQLNRSL